MPNNGGGGLGARVGGIGRVARRDRFVCVSEVRFGSLFSILARDIPKIFRYASNNFVFKIGANRSKIWPAYLVMDKIVLHAEFELKVFQNYFLQNSKHLQIFSKKMVKCSNSFFEL